jgi:hypothetical protein
MGQVQKLGPQNRPIRQERIGTAEGWPEGRSPGMDFVTADTGIFNANKINNLLIFLKQAIRGTVRQNQID